MLISLKKLDKHFLNNKILTILISQETSQNDIDEVATYPFNKRASS